MNTRRGLIGGLLSALGLAALPPEETKMKAVAGEALKLHVPERHAQIRVWKLGSLEHKILPSDNAMGKLGEILKNWDGKSDLDLIWGPDISVEVINTHPDDVNYIRIIKAEPEVKLDS